MVNIFNSSKDDEKDDEAIRQIHEDLQEIAQELKVSNTHAMVHNALLLLESQYNIPDSIMSVDEIKHYYTIIANYLFADLQGE